MNKKGKLKLSDVRHELPFTIQSGMVLRSIDKFASSNSRYNIDYDVYLPSKGKNLQRGFCWTLSQRQELIFSVLKGIQIPPIAIVIYKDDISGNTDEQTLKIIDGKQRLSTLISFVRNEFPITWKGKDYYYSDMEEDAQKTIGYYYPRFDIAYEYPDLMITDDDKIAWFEMINFAGTPQDAEHLKELKS